MDCQHQKFNNKGFFIKKKDMTLGLWFILYMLSDSI